MSTKIQAADDGSPYAHISITAQRGQNGQCRPEETQIRLSTGHQLGHVQAVHWSARVDGRCVCTVETILDPAELKALFSDTTIKIKLYENPISMLWTYYSQWLYWRFYWHIWCRLFSNR